MIPSDPIILLSYINTQLRDNYANLLEFCQENEVEQEEIEKKLAGVNYFYDETLNQFR